ncbi:MAG: hypothetical protein U0939_01820 [Pirellulales bacterium]
MSSPRSIFRRLWAASLMGSSLLLPGWAAAVDDGVVRSADCPCRKPSVAWNGEPTPHYSTPHYSTPHYSTPHYSTPHYSTPHYSTPHYSTHVYAGRTYVNTRVRRQGQTTDYEAVLNRLGGAQTIWSGDSPDRVIGVALRGDSATDANLAILGRLRELQIVIVAPSKASAVTDAGLRHLANLSNLEYLSLGGTSVTDAGLELAANWPHLRRLELSGAITDAGLPHLVQLAELEQLRVWPAKITNEGLAVISQMRCLRFLDLNATHIDDAGLPHLQSLTSLEILDLRRTAVTGAGLEHLVPKPDADAMHFSGPSRLRKLYLPSQTVVSGESLTSLIRLLGICEIETSRPQAEPGKPPRPSETVVPELTKTWLERAMLEGFREEITQWKSLGAYIEFADSLVDPDFVGSIPPAMLEGKPSPDDLQRLASMYREQAYRHITGIYFVRPRTKDDRPRDDRIFPVTLGPSRLPPMLERLSLRDTEVSASTIASVVVPSIRAGVPLKVLNVFGTSARGSEAVTKEGFDPVLGKPGSNTRPHLPFNPGQSSIIVPSIADRQTLSPEELTSFGDALAKLDAIVVNEEQSERIRTALPALEGKLKVRPRYLPGELPACSVADDGTLKPMFCMPTR